MHRVEMVVVVVVAVQILVQTYSTYTVPRRVHLGMLLLLDHTAATATQFIYSFAGADLVIKLRNNSVFVAFWPC
jgi:hypothetical protein